MDLIKWPARVFVVAVLAGCLSFVSLEWGCDKTGAHDNHSKVMGSFFEGSCVF